MKVLSVLFFSAVAFAQVDGIVGTSSRTVTLTPSEAVFTVMVNSDSSKTIDDILPKVKDLGIGTESLVSINLQSFGPPPAPSRLSYQFRLVVPIARIKDTNDKLAQLRRNETELDIQGFLQGLQPTSAAVEETANASSPNYWLKPSSAPRTSPRRPTSTPAVF